jgi:hypothetical protein
VGAVGEAPVNVHATKIRQPVRGRARFDSKRLEGASLEGGGGERGAGRVS